MSKLETKKLIESCIATHEAQIDWAKRWKSTPCLVRCGWTIILEQGSSWSLFKKQTDTSFSFSGDATDTTYFTKERAENIASLCADRSGIVRIIHMNELADKILAELPERLESFKEDLEKLKVKG